MSRESSSPTYYSEAFINFLGSHGIKVIRSDSRFHLPPIDPTRLYRLVDRPSYPLVRNAVDLFSQFVEADLFVDGYGRNHTRRRAMESRAERDPNFGKAFTAITGRNPYNSNQLTAVAQYLRLLGMRVASSKSAQEPLKSTVADYLTDLSRDLHQRITGSDHQRVDQTDRTFYDGLSLGRKTATITYYQVRLYGLYAFLQTQGLIPAPSPRAAIPPSYLDQLALDRQPGDTVSLTVPAEEQTS